MASTAARNSWVLKAALVVAVPLFVMAGPAPVHADETDRARKLLQEGDDHMSRGDQRRNQGREKRAMGYYEKALASYRKAYALVPTSSIFLAIAEAETKLGRYKDALAHYQRVIAEVEREELKQQARQRIEALRPHLATFMIKGLPPGADISIDAELRAVAPMAEPIVVSPGEHTLTITAEGYTPHEESITLEVGKTTEREIAMEKTPVMVKMPSESADEVVPQAARVAERPRQTPAPGKAKVLVGGAATVVFAAGATVTGLMAMSRHDTFSDPATDPDARDSAQRSGKTLALVTDVLIGSAIIAGAYTMYQYVGVYRPERAAHDRELATRNDPKLWLSAYVDGEGGGLAVGGRF